MFKNIIGWIASILTCIGVTMNCLNIFPYNIYVLTIASVCYLAWSFMLEERSLSFTVVNVYLLLVNIFGTIRSLI